MNRLRSFAVSAAVGAASFASAGAAPTPSPPAAVNRSESVADRAAMIRAMKQRFGKTIVQRFPVAAGLTPIGRWKTVHSTQEANAIKAGADYQRRCAAGDPSLPARVDTVREPVAPGAVVQIAGDCFGNLPGSVTLSGLGPAAVRLAVQSWSSTAISATVPGVPNARRQTVVLAVIRAPGAARYAADSVSAVSTGVRTGVAAHTAVAGATAAPGSSTPIKPPLPGEVKTVTTRPVGAATAAAAPPNEATVDFWPELERRTVGAEAIVNRTCAFPTCLNAGQEYSVWASCAPPCGDHEAQSSKPSGIRDDGWHWLHAGDDAWVVRHPALWQVERVDIDVIAGTVAAGQPQELSAAQTVVPIHWQDMHNVYNDNETGLWFFCTYQFSATLVGPKGTWPA